MCWLFYTSLQNKTHYRRVAPFARSQKSQHKYIVSKLLSGLETSFPNKRHDGGGGAEGGWNKNILCGKNRKINLRGQRLLGAQEYIFPANCRKLNVF